MEIEIAKPERMSQSGSSLLRLIQNNNMPILDLLVRESIQNSLDAADNGEYKDVLVKFKTDKFESNKFCNELELVGEKLNKRFSGTQNEFLAIRDYHTVGLTGVMNYNNVKNNDYGNLLKLVYEISKPQSEEGAGGSWGLGKTVYFRVGIGLVVYYSRIHLDNGNFQSRMAVTYVEDETSPDSIIPPYNNKDEGLKRGIAWWGEKTGENQTEPITNEKEINRVLNIFHLEPYQNSETGTTIIIPFINSENLLRNNVIESDDNDKPIHLYWKSTVKEYLKFAVKRWYSPRLDNPQYPNGRYLTVNINGEDITSDRMEPSYRLIQLLYNEASSEENNVVDTEDVQFFREKIQLRNVLEKSSFSGTLCAAKVNKKFLHMDPPDNNLPPYMYYNCNIKSMDSNRDSNKSVICFTRKPGMIVSYHTIGDWAEGLPETDLDHYIIAIFVLNSNNTLKKTDNFSLEEYVRKSEMADHTDWSDYSINGLNPRIISKSQKQIIKKISKQFSEPVKIPDQRKDVGLGRVFGEMFLPPEDFGHTPSVKGKNALSPRVQTTKHKNIKFSIYPDDTEYHMNNMILHLGLKSRKPLKGILLNLEINSESESISADKWEENFGLEMPFYIEKIEKISFDNKTIDKFPGPNQYIDDLKCMFELNCTKSEYKTPYQIKIKYTEPEKCNFDMYVKIFIKDKSVKPVFKCSEMEDASNE